MDTSKKYVQMCDKTKEIQKGWKLKEQDTYAVLSSAYKKGYEIEYINGYYKQYREECWLEIILKGASIGKKDVKIIWLPRQDQLQEMIFTSPSNCWFKLTSFDAWRAKTKWPYKSLPMTMEQLWLAFVMEDKYGKGWDDKNEKWITQQT